jgi:hypothetical protein
VEGSRDQEDADQEEHLSLPSTPVADRIQDLVNFIGSDLIGIRVWFHHK